MNRITRWMLVALVAPGTAAGQAIKDIPAADREIDAVAEEAYTVGSMLGEDWETFADVRSVGFDGEGNLYILDGENHRVVVVGPSGALVRELGKEGDGPGELRFPMGMVVAPDGSVAVQDIGHQAFVLFDAEGRFTRNVRNELRNGLMDPAIHYHPGGGAVGVSRAFISEPGAGRARMPSGAPVRMVPFAEGEEIRDLHTAWRRPLEMSTGSRADFSSSQGNIQLSGMPRQRAFDPILAAGVLPDGRIAVVDSTAYRIKLIDPEGRHETTLFRPIDPRPVTRRDQEAERERRLEEIENDAGGGGAVMIVQGPSGGGGGTHRVGGGAMTEMRRQMVENMDFAEEMPVISGMAVDWDGRIWVQRSGRAVGQPGPTDVIGADGSYFGTIRPDGPRIPQAFGPGGLMAYVERDEYDVESVVVRRIPAIR
jgi:hypothetical protein